MRSYKRAEKMLFSPYLWVLLSAFSLVNLIENFS